MVNLLIDVTDLGGEAHPGDKVVLWKPAAAGSATHAGRVISTAPVDVLLTDGKATVPDVEPGEMRVLLQCRGFESHTPIPVTVPDGTGTVTLRSLLESQFEYSPPVVSAVQQAADRASDAERGSIEAQVRSEAAADRADAKVDEAINNGAALVRDEVKQDADRAVSARQAATQSESNAAASEGAAASSASNAAASETNAKQSETNAGDYAAVATTAATEAVDAMESASVAVTSIANSVNAAAGHADRASQSESGAAAYAQNASDAADRVGTAEQVGTWAQQAQDAADRIGTAETVEGWADDARNSASSASTSESKAKEYRDDAATAASSAVDNARIELGNIVSDAADYATGSATSAAQAKTSETNAATHEANSLSAAERAEFAAKETIQQVSGDFATRNYVDASAWTRGVVDTSVTSIDELDFGSWGIASTTVANNLNLPFAQGTLQISRINTGKTVVGVANVVGAQQLGMWVTSISGGVAAPWKRIDNDDDDGDSTSTPGLKTVAMALTAGSYTDGVAGRYRVLAQVTAPVVRWRVHVESRRMLSNTTSTFTLGNVYVGNHSGNGAMSGEKQIKSGDSTVAAGSEWVSSWMDATLLTNETLVDVSVDGSELYRSQATSWVYEGSSWVSSKGSPVSIWVELETFDQVPVVGMIGDSTGAGQGADRPVFDSALYIAARENKFIPMAYAYPGSSMQSINDYGLHIFQRWAHLDKPDSVIIQSGSNDIHAGTPTAELQTRFVDLMETAEKISPVVIGATVKSRYPDSGEHQTTLNAHNAFVRTRANGNRDYVDFYQALSPTGTVAAADAADAAHLTTSGHQKLATAFDSVTVSRPAWVDTAKELDTKADKFYVDQRVPVDSFTGTGSPEGKIAAPVGSIYTDSAATTGAIRWVKTSGSGTAGWRVEYGDTGWRNVSSQLESGVAGNIFIARVGQTVHMMLHNVSTANAGHISLISLPSGFRPFNMSGANWRNGALTTDNGDTVRISSYHNGFMRVLNMPTGKIFGGSISMVAESAWPTSLPGLPV